MADARMMLFKEQDNKHRKKKTIAMRDKQTIAK